MSGRWRVIENPDDGTSPYRARVIYGEGLTTTLRALFVDAQPACEYAAQLNKNIDELQPNGELWLDSEGAAHFDCHTHGEDFATTRQAIQKFIDVLQRQLDNEPACPYFAVSK